jgi:hypothetical protein
LATRFTSWVRKLSCRWALTRHKKDGKILVLIASQRTTNDTVVAHSVRVVQSEPAPRVKVEYATEAVNWTKHWLPDNRERD